MAKGATRIEITASPSAEDCKVVIGGLAAFNKTFVELQSVPLASLLRDGEGMMLGGLLGHTSGGWLSIDVLWLPDELRGQGIGAQLVADAEVEARRRGCVGAYVNTGSFQAPGFYERLGFEVCGVIEDYPRGHRRLTLSKRLDGTGPATAPVDHAGA
jgi:ribosomal protein S18 acetylase RimI-like enzyme